MLKNIMRLFRTRGERRRQDIMTLLEGHPDHKYTAAEIFMALGSWAGVVGPELRELHRRGKILRHVDEHGQFVHQARSKRKEVSA